MIIYKNIMEKLKVAGYNPARIRAEKLLPESTLQRIRNGEKLSIDTIDTLCRLLNCQPGDLLEFREDGEE